MREADDYYQAIDRVMQRSVTRRLFNRLFVETAAASTVLIPASPAFVEVLARITQQETEEDRILGRYPFYVGAHDKGDNPADLKRAIADGIPLIEGNIQVADNGFAYLKHDPTTDLHAVISLDEFAWSVTDGGCMAHLDIKDSAAKKRDIVRAQTRAPAKKRRMLLSSKAWSALDYFREWDDDYLLAYTVTIDTKKAFMVKLGDGDIDGQLASVNKSLLFNPNGPDGVDIDFLFTCHQHDVAILTWIMNNLEEAEKLIPYFEQPTKNGKHKRLGGFNSDHPEIFNEYKTAA